MDRIDCYPSESEKDTENLKKEPFLPSISNELTSRGLKLENDFNSFKKFVKNDSNVDDLKEELNNLIMQANAITGNNVPLFDKKHKHSTNICSHTDLTKHDAKENKILQDDDDFQIISTREDRPEKSKRNNRKLVTVDDDEFIGIIKHTTYGQNLNSIMSDTENDILDDDLSNEDYVPRTQATQSNETFKIMIMMKKIIIIEKKIIA